MKNSQLPHAEELEETIIGTCLSYANAIGETVEIFRNQPVFHNKKHQEIYDTMLVMFNASEEVDLLTVSQKLRERKKLKAVGGDIFLIELTQKVSTSAHLERHCRIIQQFFVKRKAIDVGRALMEKSFEDDADIFELMDKSYNELDNVSEWLYTKKPEELPDISKKLLHRAENNEVGVPSCLNYLTEKTNGYQKSDLVILAARPGMGKTALMLNEALKAAKSGYPVGIFSLEMSDVQLVGRLLSNYCTIPADRLSKNTLTNDDKNLIKAKLEHFDKLPIYIHDQAALSTLQLKIQASKWKRDKDIKMIFVDYLQLMKSHQKTGNREQEISNISQALKGLAKELDIPVMALSQLSRAVETRGGSKRPLLSDLRESGSIEQDADMVMFAYRPEYYGIEEWDYEDGGSTANQCEINLAKYRGGEGEAIICRTDLRHMRFMDLEDYSQPIAPGDPSSAFDGVPADYYTEGGEEDNGVPF